MVDVSWSFIDTMFLMSSDHVVLIVDITRFCLATQLVYLYDLQLKGGVKHILHLWQYLYPNRGSGTFPYLCLKVM